MLTETIEDARKEMDKTVEAFRHDLQQELERECVLAG